ncbi:MAG: Mut7-C RNAse domain-containing protein [Chloroflexota bacterium]
MVEQPTAQIGHGPPVRLVADAMLGRLARWLRALGYDTVYDQRLEDPALARMARAEGRLLLTRDRQLARRRALWAVLVENDDLSAQLVQVLPLLGPPPSGFGRCVACNGCLEEVDHASAESRVPQYVWETQPDFALCRACGRLYWRGSHWHRIKHQLAALGLSRSHG